MDGEFFGFVDLEGNVHIWLQCVDTNGVPVAPTGTPTATLYEGDQDSPMTSGSEVAMTGPVNSQTGLYRLTHPCTAATGYERQKTYFVQRAFVYSGTTYKQNGTFVVV